MVFLSPFILSSEQPQQHPEDDDIELGELPSFVNPELVQERLVISIPPNIDFPMAAHLRPSPDPHPVTRPDSRAD